MNKSLKKNLYFALFLIVPIFGFSNEKPNREKKGNKGQFYMSWGWNREWYTKSDIHFKGDNYDFTLKNTVGKDRQSPFTLKTYFYPESASIPQTNFRMGYFINDKYTVSLGFDHMKYVVQRNQVVKISGEIAGTNTVYDRTYSDEDITISPDFLQFEHTDGLNYVNADLRRFDKIYSRKNINLSFIEGIGIGFLRPRTDVTFIGSKRNDKFHITGYGFSGIAGINFTYKHIFIQSEINGGYINMPDIRTTSSPNDKASQSFFYFQVNGVVGFNLNFNKKRK